MQPAELRHHPIVRQALESFWECLDYVKDTDGMLSAQAYDTEYRKIVAILHPALAEDEASLGSGLGCGVGQYARHRWRRRS